VTGINKSVRFIATLSSACMFILFYSVHHTQAMRLYLTQCNNELSTYICFTYCYSCFAL